MPTPLREIRCLALDDTHLFGGLNAALAQLSQFDAMIQPRPQAGKGARKNWFKSCVNLPVSPQLKRLRQQNSEFWQH
jgi:hypothetical protein